MSKIDLSLDFISNKHIQNLLELFVNSNTDYKFNKRLDKNLLIYTSAFYSQTYLLGKIQNELEKNNFKCLYVDCSIITKSGLINILSSNIDYLLLDSIESLDMNMLIDVLRKGEFKHSKNGKLNTINIKNIKIIATTRKITSIPHAIIDFCILCWLRE